MRILYLHQYFATRDMAGGSRSYEMARRLVARGHEVDVITSEQKPQAGWKTGWRVSNETGIRVHWTPVYYDNRLTYSDRIRAFGAFALRSSRKCLDFRPDIIFATSTPLTIAVPAILAKKHLKCPMVFEVRDLWPAVPIAIGALRNPASKAMALWLERRAYLNAARVVALAPGMRDHIVERGVPPERVDVIPNGCDLDLFDVEPRAGEDLRHRYNWLDNRPLVLFAGTLGRVNGVDYLVRIAEICLQKAPEIRFVLIGDGSEREAISSVANQAGVLNRNFFMLGALPKRELPAWFSAATLTVALFTGPRIVWKDAVQNKFFDSLAAGRPIASNHLGWQTEIALRAGCGIVMDPDDAIAGAQTVISALGNDAWINSARTAARLLARERFDRDILAGQLEKTFLAVLNRSTS